MSNNNQNFSLNSIIEEIRRLNREAEGEYEDEEIRERLNNLFALLAPIVNGIDSRKAKRDEEA